MKPIRLALVGAGIFMHDAHLPSLLKLSDAFEVVAVYSRSEASARRLAQLAPGAPRIFTDYGALVADSTIEAVDIVLPIPVMAPYIAQALAAGKHVISEKPIAADTATAGALIAQHEAQSHQVWMVGENWRYESAFVQAATLIRSGVIGRPVACHCALYAPVLPTSKYYGSHWRESGELPGGYLLDGGVHHVAAFRLLVGEIEAVSAVVSQVSPRLPPADTICAHLRFANGALGAYVAGYAAGAPWPPYFHVVGETGALRVQRGVIEVTSGGQTQTVSCDKYDGVVNELRAFADAVRSGRPHANPPEEALSDLAVIEALLAAAQSGAVAAVNR